MGNIYADLLGIQKDQHDDVMNLWEKGKTDTEIAEYINRHWRDPQGIRRINRRTIGRVIQFARRRHDPRAVYHGNHNLRPISPERPEYRKPKDSLFRRKRRSDPVETKPEEFLA